ncbi:hypothetical protein C1645_807493 [Glomus cerebriforme]|uniref:Uncharacterized protein n=1 Tax=Glomus cerebriforme TaxID=658196 RepID=A0A397SSP5_9GLOM|nr:hypothetical protein C1645_807493 [Glomus cerebriforme]
MDISIAEQFEIENELWTMYKCKRFLRFIQQSPDATRIKIEQDDEKHKFLPKYFKLVNSRKHYEWKSKDLHDIFVAIFRFLYQYYPELNELNRMKLQTKHDEKINEWNIKYPKYLENKDKEKEAKLQDTFIKEVNGKWLSGFEYLYDFEYQHEDHRGDLIFANNHGILAAVETKRAGFNPIQIYKNIDKAEKQAIKYRNFLMEKTKDDSSVITVLGVYFIDILTKKYKWIPSDMDHKIWKAIKMVHKNNDNNNSPDFDQQSATGTIGNKTLELLSEINEDEENEIDKVTDKISEISLNKEKN